MKVAVRVIPFESGERAGEIGALVGIELCREGVMRGRGTGCKQHTRNGKDDTEESVAHESLLERECCPGVLSLFPLDVHVTTPVSNPESILSRRPWAGEHLKCLTRSPKVIYSCIVWLPAEPSVMA